MPKLSVSILFQWYDLCKAFLQEAKWSYNKIIPGVEEYLNNGWVSSSGQVMLTHAYFLSNPSTRKEELESLEHYHDLLRLPSLIFRLTNDLATSSVRILSAFSSPIFIVSQLTLYKHFFFVAKQVKLITTYS